MTKEIRQSLKHRWLSQFLHKLNIDPNQPKIMYVHQFFMVIHYMYPRCTSPRYQPSASTLHWCLDVSPLPPVSRGTSGHTIVPQGWFRAPARLPLGRLLVRARVVFAHVKEMWVSMEKLLADRSPVASGHTATPSRGLPCSPKEYPDSDLITSAPTFIRGSGCGWEACAANWQREHKQWHHRKGSWLGFNILWS